MRHKERHIDPLPEEFETYEEAAEFWDTHDTMDYPEAFRTVEVEAEFRGRRYEVELEEDVALALRERAKKEGLPIGRLASELLRRQLAAK